MTDPPISAIQPDSDKRQLFAELLADLDASTVVFEETPPTLLPPPKSLDCKTELESSGHLSAKVLLLWGSSDLDLFIRSLFLDSRDGERRGLRSEIVAELLFLAKTNKTLRALDAVKTLGLSFHEAHRLIDEGDEARMVASQNRAAQRHEPITLASRHKATEESFWTTLFRGNFIIYLMITAICGILLWLLVR